MNEILLYLSLKYSGDWMAIYNSLQKREKVNAEEIKDVKASVPCTYTTLLDDEYPEGLKNIYKPPFGIFSYGKYELINNKCIVTILGEINQETKPYIDEIRKNNGGLVWVNLTNREIMNVLNQFKTNNLFWMPELKNENNNTFKHILEDETITTNNLFYSELWTVNKDTDYSSQLSERMYFGLTHNVLVVSKLNSKQLLSLANYASDEDIKIVFKKELFEDKFRKIFSRCKVWLIDKKEEIIDYFFNEK